jgi:hypothetical protein
MIMASQRDVVFTPFMLRVREVLDGADRSAPLRLRSSTLQPFARATDEWFYLRARSEQVIAEANAMLTGRAELVDIEDEVGTGTLAFVLQCGEQSARISMGQAGRQGWVELERRHARSAQPLEPKDPDVLEDLVIELLGSRRSSTDG